MTRDGFLYVIDTTGKPSAREWPAFRHDARNSGRYGAAAGRMSRTPSTLAAEAKLSTRK